MKLACLSYVNSPIRYGPILPRPLELGEEGRSKDDSGAGFDLGSIKNQLSRMKGSTSPTSRNRDAQSISMVGPHCYVDLQVHEVLQLKEGLLRNCQRLLHEAQNIELQHPS